MQKQFRNASDSQEQICGSGNCRETVCHAIPGLSFPCIQRVSPLLSSVADYLLNTDKAPDWILRYVVAGHALTREQQLRILDFPNLEKILDFCISSDHWLCDEVLFKILDLPSAVPFLQRYSLFHMLPEELLMKVFDIPNGKDVIVNYSSVYHSLPNKALKIAQQRGWM